MLRLGIRRVMISWVEKLQCMHHKMVQSKYIRWELHSVHKRFHQYGSRQFGPGRLPKWVAGELFVESTTENDSPPDVLEQSEDLNPETEINALDTTSTSDDPGPINMSEGIAGGDMPIIPRRYNRLIKWTVTRSGFRNWCRKTTAKIS